MSSDGQLNQHRDATCFLKANGRFTAINIGYKKEHNSSWRSILCPLFISETPYLFVSERRPACAHQDASVPTYQSTDETFGIYSHAWSHDEPKSINPLILRSLLILVGSVFLAAAIYISLDRLVK